MHSVPQSSRDRNSAHASGQTTHESGTATLDLVDNRSEALAQRQLADAIHQRPHVSLSTKIHHSPYMVAQRKQVDSMIGSPAQLKEPASKPNHTGLPDNLKSGIESLSGFSMDHVKTHYNSPQPAKLNALAYAQGSDIHIAPKQEQHLPHEAWHVVQQAQGRVAPTKQMKGGVAVNDDEGLEREADVMGAKALKLQPETLEKSLSTQRKSETYPNAAYPQKDGSGEPGRSTQDISRSTQHKGHGKKIPGKSGTQPLIQAKFWEKKGDQYIWHEEDPNGLFVKTSEKRYSLADSSVWWWMPERLFNPLYDVYIRALSEKKAKSRSSSSEKPVEKTSVRSDSHENRPRSSPKTMPRRTSSERSSSTTSSVRNNTNNRLPYESIDAVVMKNALGQVKPRKNEGDGAYIARVIYELQNEYSIDAFESETLHQQLMEIYLSWQKAKGKEKKKEKDEDLLGSHDGDLRIVVHIEDQTFNSKGELIEFIKKVHFNVSKKSLREAISKLERMEGASSNKKLIRQQNNNAKEMDNLRMGIHCSSGMGADGLVFFFIKEKGGVRVIAIGHHDNNSSQQYNILWAADGYPKGKVQFKGAK